MRSFLLAPLAACLLFAACKRDPPPSSSATDAAPGLAASGTSVSPEAVRMCRENGIEVIPGACPNQFLHPDFGHAMMRRLWRACGFMKIDEKPAPTA